MHEQNEDLSIFAASVRTIAENYEFGDTLNDVLCDRIVVVKNNKIQQRLFSEDKPDYEKFVSIGQAILTAEKDIRDL